MAHIGIMQGRMIPPTDNRIQCFPRERWADEFELAAERPILLRDRAVRARARWVQHERVADRTDAAAFSRGADQGGLRRLAG